MKLHVLSDLHLEFGSFHAPAMAADAVVLAGDIGSGAQGLRWAIETFRVPVIYVLGNHDFYGKDLDIVDGLKRMASGTHVRVLERDAVVVAGIRFLGCTLWTDFGLFGPGQRDATLKLADSMVRDFHVITDHGQRFTAQRSRAEHLASRAWLQRELSDDASGSPTVVVTHHAPYPTSVPSRFRKDPLSAAFVSNLKELMGRPSRWIHGHTHASFDYVVNGTRVVCNAKGYPVQAAPTRHENPGFDPGFTVEVDAHPVHAHARRDTARHDR